MSSSSGYPFSVLLYIITAEVLAILIDANTRIKGVQKGDHEMKILNFVDGTTIFLEDINCLTRKQSILKFDEKVFISKINFSKMQAFIGWGI